MRIPRIGFPPWLGKVVTFSLGRKPAFSYLCDLPRLDRQISCVNATTVVKGAKGTRSAREPGRSLNPEAKFRTQLLDLPLAPRTESYDTRIARHDLERGYRLGEGRRSCYADRRARRQD